MSDKDNLSKINDLSVNFQYIADCLYLLERILKNGSCNSCKFENCYYRPAPGESVRWNCPFYKSKSSSDEPKDFGDVIEKITGEPCERRPWSVIVPYEEGGTVK